MRSPSKWALSRVGRPVVWEQTEPAYRFAEGTCIGVRRVPGTTITTDDGEFPAVQFLVLEADGTETWTCSFADDNTEPIGDLAT